MSDIVLDKKSFFKTILLFVGLSVVWTIVCILTDEFTDTDKGMVSGLGFLLILPISIYVGQRLKKMVALGSLMLLTVLTFLVGSYILGPLVGMTSNSMILYSIINSLFIAVAMTLFLQKITAIELTVMTILLTFFCLLLAYFLIDEFSDTLYMDFNLHPRITLFNIFQFLLITPLTFGMNLKRVIRIS